MREILSFLAFLFLASESMANPANDLVVYPAVPGLTPSPHYQVRVRSAKESSEWLRAFAWETVCKEIDKKSDAYFDTLAGWTHTYVNFETAGAVEIEISRVNGKPIRTAAVHPQRQASGCTVNDGKVLVRLDKPGLVAVDIDGQMDGQDTGKGYKGPPIHTISIFANPILADKPKPDAPGVLTVKPGEKPPSNGSWTTLYFLPGVHDIGLAFPLRANCNYYIPGDAIVYGTLSNTKWGDGHHIRIFGLGTLSGARLKHPKYVEPAVPEKEHARYRPIEVVGTTDTRVEGITIADSANHSLMLIHPYKEGHPNEVKWTKIFTWRANGDGINPFGNTLIEDCFIRTQDDSLYVNGLGIHRTVLWNDANGSSFVLSGLPDVTDRKVVVEDCDVIYSRAKWHHWSGGRVFNMRGEGGRPAGGNVVFRNINIEDPRPTLQQFFVCMTVPEPYSKQNPKRKPGDLSGIQFQNVSVAAPSVLGEPQMLWGQADARIRNLTFENLTVAGKPVTEAKFFKTNEFVDGLKFVSRAKDLDLEVDPKTGKPGGFAAEEIRRDARTKGMPLGAGANATRVILTVEKDGKAAPQSYRIRVTNDGGRRVITVRGVDQAGAMYGGLDIAEAIRLGTLDSLKDSDHKPHIAQRGIKFNIPLDKRQPSFDDNGTSARENFQHVWDMAFWRDYIDTLARQRYNVLSLWNRHPFPSLVKVPGYEAVALDDVYDKQGKLIRKMPHAEKVKFWNDVIAYAQDRGIDVWWYVWNIHVFGTEETKYGLTDSPDNAKTKDYLRKSVAQLFHTYPKLKGLGMCPGEHFGEKNKDHDFKEQWCWDTYGEGILDYKKTNPDREIGFIHRYWLTDFKQIGHRFAKLPDGYDLEYKYSKARLYSAPNPPFAKKDILDATPAKLKSWWNLRNDDIFLVRWGDPDYVKQAVLAFPGQGRTAGYVLGSDRFCWGRESASKTPALPRQLENDKHWYSFMLWGRLGYDPETSPVLLQALIEDRFQIKQGAKLYATWQAASRIIPLVNRTRYVPWDYMWWVEGCRGNLLDKSIQGFHTVDIFLDKRWGGMEGTKHIGLHEFVFEGKTAGITPLDAADQLDALASDALKGAAEIADGGNAELRETLGDIRAQARLGQYYAAKIRGAVSVGLFRKTGEAKHQTDAVAHLEKALTAWRDYGKELDALYTNKLYISGQKTFDWLDDSGPKSDIEIAKKEKE